MSKTTTTTSTTRKGRRNDGSNKTHDTFVSLAERVVSEMTVNPDSWTQPWVDAWRGDGFPVNVATGRPYTGGNVMQFALTAMLNGYQGPAWGTYNQWKALGGQVRRGEHGTAGLRAVVKEYETDELDPFGRPLVRRQVFFSPFTVFHADQVEGGQEIAAQRLGGDARRFEHEPLVEAERLLKASGAVFKTGTAAFYNGGDDTITLPPLDRFPSRSRYYLSALHELVHWTQKPLGRWHGPVQYGGEEYAFEELVAELGSVFLGAGYLGLDVRLREDHASYLAGWIQAIRNDPRVIWKAARLAEQAANYILALAGAAEVDDDDDESKGVMPEALVSA